MLIEVQRTMKPAAEWKPVTGALADGFYWFRQFTEDPPRPVMVEGETVHEMAGKIRREILDIYQESKYQFLPLYWGQAGTPATRGA